MLFMEKRIKEIFIKNMVCPRCVLIMEQIFNEQMIPFEKIEIGKVIFRDDFKLSHEAYQRLENAMQQVGFEILDDLKIQLIEKIIIFMREKIDKSEEVKLSEQISKLSGYDYSYISKIFSQTVGKTLEQYMIDLRINKAKEYLKYKQMSFIEIAELLGYNHPAHFSRQFKQQTGMTPTEFRNHFTVKVQEQSLKG